MNVGLVILQGFLKGRFSILLLMFALIFLVMPLVPSGGMAIAIYSLLGIALALSCLRAISKTRTFMFFMAGFSVLLIIMQGTELFASLDPHWYQGLVLVLRVIYHLLVFCGIMRYVLDATPVTADKIYGALSAYFLMGFMWSMVFQFFQHTNPESFNVASDAHGSWATYFSFTTLSTLGYGDITPQTVPARGYAVMEAVCGQIFLAVIMARLIALQIAPSDGQKS